MTMELFRGKRVAMNLVSAISVDLESPDDEGAMDADCFYFEGDIVESDGLFVHFLATARPAFEADADDDTYQFDKPLSLLVPIANISGFTELHII